MDLIELAERYYTRIAPRSGADWPNVSVRKVMVWLKDHVCPAVERQLTHGIFQAHARWPREVLAASSLSPVSSLVRNVDGSLVEAATALLAVDANKRVRNPNWIGCDSRKRSSPWELPYGDLRSKADAAWRPLTRLRRPYASFGRFLRTLVKVARRPQPEHLDDPRRQFCLSAYLLPAFLQLPWLIQRPSGCALSQNVGFLTHDQHPSGVAKQPPLRCKGTRPSLAWHPIGHSSIEVSRRVTGL